MWVPDVGLESVLHLALVVLGQLHGRVEWQQLHPGPQLWGDGATELRNEVELMLLGTPLLVERRKKIRDYRD